VEQGLKSKNSGERHLWKDAWAFVGPKSIPEMLTLLRLLNLARDPKGERTGRRRMPFDSDAEHMTEMKLMVLRDGRSALQAATKIAERISSWGGQESVADRLRNKWRKKMTFREPIGAKVPPT